MTPSASAMLRILLRLPGTLLLLLTLLAPGAAAIEETVVTATRVERDPLRIPLSVATVEADDVQRRQLLGLDESLARVPGLFFSNRYNYSRDLRISIRGFGARSNFGVRGLKVYVDGIPSTVTDGQTVLDDLDLSNVERIEVIRGPASALYGASAGGVINIHTQTAPETPFAEAGVSLGEFDFNRYLFKAGGEAGALNYFVNGSYLSYDGFRQHSTVEHGTVNSKLRYTFADDSVLQLIFRAADSPTADDSGGLSAAEVAADRKQARSRNVNLDAGEAVEEQKFAWSWQKSLGVHELSLNNYYNWRDFNAKLPLPPFLGTGVVRFDRFFFGGGAQYSNATPLFGHANRITVGFEMDSQSDDRQRFDNLAGRTGPLMFDQEELAESIGVYLQNEFAVTAEIDVVAGLRYDRVEFEIDDRFLANGDQSDGLEFEELNPMIGVLYGPMQALNVYANYAYSFETPTFTEFANPAQNGTLGGFANVAAQRARGWELGLKGLIAGRLRYDVAYYDMNVEDEVTTVTNVGGRAFFNNADTDRRGFELGLTAAVLEGLDLSIAYTYSDLEFDRFPSDLASEGNTLPGVPSHYAYFELDYTHDSGFWLKWDWNYTGSLFADNANAVKLESYLVSNVVFGRDFTFGRVTLSPNFGVNNLFDEQYNQEIRIQAAVGRFFEPAPDRNVFGGLRLRYDFDG